MGGKICFYLSVPLPVLLASWKMFFLDCPIISAGCPKFNKSIACPAGKKPDRNGCPTNECSECSKINLGFLQSVLLVSFLQYKETERVMTRHD